MKGGSGKASRRQLPVRVGHSDAHNENMGEPSHSWIPVGNGKWAPAVGGGEAGGIDGLGMGFIHESCAGKECCSRGCQICAVKSVIMGMRGCSCALWTTPMAN